MSKQNKQNCQQNELDEILSDSDFGMVFDKDGNLKGVFMPTNTPKLKDIPESIIAIFSMFGVDDISTIFNDKENSGRLH